MSDSLVILTEFLHVFVYAKIYGTKRVIEKFLAKDAKIHTVTV